MGLYRLHQGSCLPRYDQAANGIYDAQRHETMLLKQRFLENKAKKTKRADNRHAPVRDGENKNAVALQSKLKRPAGSPLLDCNIDGLSDNLQNKIPRNSTPDQHNNSSLPQSQQQQQQGGMPSFSVQIVQQFTSSNTSQSPHSQTIQTNVTVQAVPGSTIKTSNSPMTASTISATASPGSAKDVNMRPNPGNNTNGSTSISVGTSIECKQEPEVNFAPCSMSNSHKLNDLSGAHNDGPGVNGAGSTTCTPTTGIDNLGDRFSDSLANLGFPEDSSEDVIHPDILKDIIDDVFTNPSDLMNGFSFVDNLKDNSGNNGLCGNLIDDKDSLRMCNGKTGLHSSQTHFHNANNQGVTQFTASQSQQMVFDFQSSGGMTTGAGATPQSNNSAQNSQGFGQSRMIPYSNASPNLLALNNSNNTMGLDFKLTEPSPAAQTLKQMAEQHQNMQQKQMSLGIPGSAHPRSPFRADNFPDPLSSIRSNFLNGAHTGVNTLQKSPNNIFQSMSYNQQQSFSAATVSTVKQEVPSPVAPIYTTMNSSPGSLSEIELHKRRQQVLQIQQQQQQQQRPQFPQSPEQKTLGNSGYSNSRPLSHYNDALSVGTATQGSASNSPISHPGQFIRGVPTPGVTPPPNFSPSPGATLHLSQSQQLQISQNNQQLQVSQSQQQLLINHDMKPTINAQVQQQQHMQSRNFYPGQQSATVQMSQSQSVNFQFGNTNAVNRSSPNPTQRPQQNNVAQTVNSGGQRQLHQYSGRQPPDYQTQLDTNTLKHQMAQQMQMNTVDNRGTNQRGRKGMTPVVTLHGYGQMDPIPQSATNSLLLPNMVTTTASTGRGRGRGNSRASVTSKSTYPRQQRPPNVNVGPDGLNISQRLPIGTDWRHLYMQQQQQISTPNLQIRIPYNKGMSGGEVSQNVNVARNHFSGIHLDSNVNDNCLPTSRDLMGSQMSQMGTMTNANTSNSSHLLMQQQQQAIVQCGVGGATNATRLNPTQIQMPITVNPSMHSQDLSSLQHQYQLLSNSPKPVIKPDDSSQGLSTDGNQFLLDFLDSIDYSTTDLLTFDTMHGGGSSFPLLDDMSMLGK